MKKLHSKQRDKKDNVAFNLIIPTWITFLTTIYGSKES